MARPNILFIMADQLGAAALGCYGSGVDSTPTSIDPERGELLLSLRVNFGDTSDRIVVRARKKSVAHPTSRGFFTRGSATSTRA